MFGTYAADDDDFAENIKRSDELFPFSFFRQQSLETKSVAYNLDSFVLCYITSLFLLKPRKSFLASSSFWYDLIIYFKFFHTTYMVLENI